MKTRRPHSDPLRLDRLLEALPVSETLRPVVAQLLAASRADPERRWTGSGELGTAGGRIVDTEAFEDRARVWVEEERAGLERRVRQVSRVASALAQGDTASMVDALLEESAALEASGRSGEAREWAEAAFRAALDSGDPRTAEALRRAARCARAHGSLDDSGRLYEDAWSRARDAERWEDAVVAATGRGNVAVDRGRWAEAEEWYLRALELLDGGGPDGLSPEAARPLRWRLFQNLGITARERGVLDESDRWYRRAEEESMGLGDPAATVEVENGRGQLELARGRPRAAEVRFRAALEALTTPRADAVRVAVRANLGEALLRQGRALEAGVVAREAEAEAIQGRHLGRLPEVYRLLGRVARARGEAEAFVFVERALELVREAGLPPFEEALSLLAYAELREEQGEMDMAREAREGARVILDQLDVTRPELEAGDDTQRDGGVS